MKRLSKANVRYGFPKSVKFHFYSPVFGLFCDFIKNFIVRFIHEDDVNPTWFFPDNIYNLSFSDKKKVKSQNFTHMGFCASKVSTKFWRFAAGMDFDTQEFLNKISQMLDFCPNNSIPPIVNWIFGNFKLPLWIFQKK